MEEEKKDNQTIDDLVEHLKPLVEHMKYIHDMAFVAYTPLVDDLCSRKATQNEKTMIKVISRPFLGKEKYKDFRLVIISHS